MAFYMDSMRPKPKFKHKTISGVLNYAISKFAQRGGNLPCQGKGHKIKKFTHITDISCIEQSSHLDHLVPIQNKLVVTEDIRKICLEIKQSKFDSANSWILCENQQPGGCLETGIFCSNEGTPKDDSSRRRAGLCLLNQNKVYMLL
jgi:hypothetical protein